MQSERIRVLLVEDDGDDYILTRDMLAESVGVRFDLERAATYDAGLEALRKNGHDVCLVDYRLGARDGLELLTEAVAAGCTIPIVLFTGRGTYEVDTAAMKAGAADYLVKNEISAPLLERALRYAIERQRARQTLWKNEARLRSIFETMTEGVIVVAPNGQIVEANLAAERILGLTRGEIEERNYVGPEWEIVRADGTPMPPEEMAGPRAMREGRAVKDQVMGVKRRDGSISWITVGAAPLFDEAGLHQGIVSTFADITERMRAEEALRLDSAMMNNIVEGVCLIRARDGVILHANPQFNKMLGYGAGELIGKDFAIVNAPTDRSPRETAGEMIAALHACRFWSGEVLNIKKDGTPFWCRTTVSTCEHADYGTVWVSVHQDVTEYKQAQERIRQNAARAEALARTADRLNKQLELDVVLKVVCEETAGALNVPAVFVLLQDKQRQTLSIAALTGLPPRCQTHFIPTPVASYREYAREVGQIVVVPDVQAEPELPNHALFAEMGIRTAISASILRGGEFIGTLTALTIGQAREFTDDELALLRALAAQASQAIANAQLFADAQRRVRYMQALRDIDVAIIGSLDLGLTLNILLDHVTTQLRVDAADILLLNPRSLILDYAAGRGFRTDALQHTHLRLGDGHAGHAALERRIVHIPDLAQAENGLRRSWRLPTEGFVAYYAVPLIAKGQIKGVLELFHCAALVADADWLEFLETLGRQAAIAIDNASLFGDLQRSNVELLLAHDATIEGWSRALDLRDKETEGHTQRVAEMTMRLARMLGVNEHDLVHVRRGALLHDMGKMGVPDGILLKPGPLSDDEWTIMRKHPVFARDMLSPIAYLRPALDIPYCHHEKWDGTGYPRGLKGEQIPLAARVFSVIDVWDALRSERPYRSAWPEHKVREYIRDQASTSFDPQVVEAFLQMGVA